MERSDATGSSVPNLLPGLSKTVVFPTKPLVFLVPGVFRQKLRFQPGGCVYVGISNISKAYAV